MDGLVVCLLSLDIQLIFSSTCIATAVILWPEGDADRVMFLSVITKGRQRHSFSPPTPPTQPAHASNTEGVSNAT